MKVYVYGNPDISIDNQALKLSEKLKKDFSQVEFVVVKPNEDTDFYGDEMPLIIDVVLGLPGVRVLTKDHIDTIILEPRATVHDFGLGFQLKYLLKLGKIKNFYLIGIPLDKEVSYSSIHSTFKKLVAQDIQGS